MWEQKLLHFSLAHLMIYYYLAIVDLQSEPLQPPLLVQSQPNVNRIIIQ